MNNSEQGLLSAGWRYRWLVLVVTALVISIFLVFQLLRPQETQFAASSTVVIQEPISSEAIAGQQSASAGFVRSQLEIMRSPVVSEAAALIVQDLGIAVGADELVASSSIIGSVDSPLVLINTVALTPESAVVYANAMAEAYRQVSQRQATATSEAQLARIDAQVDGIDDRLTEIEQELATLVAENSALADLRDQADAAVFAIAELQAELVVAAGDEAAGIRQRIQDNRQVLAVYGEVLGATASSPERRALSEEQTRQVDRRARLLTLRDEIAVDVGLVPDAIALVQSADSAEPLAGLGLARLLAVALIIGLALGVGLAYFLAVSRRALTSRGEPEEVLGVPLLADVPDFDLEGLKSQVPVRDHPRSAAAEAFRFASSSLEASARIRGAKSVFFVSSTIGHGKTTTVVNTAIASAVHGRSVLILDCDFGNQEAARNLVGDRHAGLVGVTDVIEGVATIEQATHQIELGNGVSLSLMARGTRPSLAATTLQSNPARVLIGALVEAYDFVLIDGPPLLQVAYASTLAELADGVVAVVEHRGSHSELVDLADRLELVGTPVMGYIYNRSPLRREMTMSEGSMMDILGDAGFTDEPLSSRRKRSG
ncbi:hypothetical protein BH23ACT5_BH23ACT5_14800 [soil metagenome]